MEYSAVDEVYAVVVHNCALKGGQRCTIGSDLLLIPGCNVEKWFACSRVGQNSASPVELFCLSPFLFSFFFLSTYVDTTKYLYDLIICFRRLGAMTYGKHCNKYWWLQTPRPSTRDERRPEKIDQIRT